MPTASERAYERSPRSDELGRTSPDALNRQPGDPARSDSLHDQADQTLDAVKEQGRAQFDRYRNTAADQLGKVAQGARAAANEIDDGSGLSHYVADVARGLAGFADDMRGKSAEELVRDASSLARNNPALFLAGSIAIGFGLSRFARASGRRGEPQEGPAMAYDEPSDTLDEPIVEPTTPVAGAAEPVLGEGDVMASSPALSRGAPDYTGRDTFNNGLVDGAADNPALDESGPTRGIGSDVIDNNRGGLR
jgi:hypothetical protein